LLRHADKPSAVPNTFTDMYINWVRHTLSSNSPKWRIYLIARLQKLINQRLLKKLHTPEKVLEGYH